MVTPHVLTARYYCRLHVGLWTRKASVEEKHCRVMLFPRQPVEMAVLKKTLQGGWCEPTLSAFRLHSFSYFLCEWRRNVISWIVVDIGCAYDVILVTVQFQYLEGVVRYARAEHPDFFGWIYRHSDCNDYFDALHMNITWSCCFLI